MWHAWEIRNACKILVGNPEGKRRFIRRRRKCEYNIRTGLRGIGWEGVHGVHLAQDTEQWRALVNTAINLGVS